MRIIWDALRSGDRLHAGRRVCAAAGLSEDEFGELPWHLRRAAINGGLEGLLEAGFKPQSPLPEGEPAAEAEAGAADEWGTEEAPAPGVKGPRWQRQYLFVAATMPAEGERSVGAEIAERFPDAVWLAGLQLHQSKRSVEHVWRRVDDVLDREEALRDVVAADAGLASGAGRMLVFASDVASADATADALEAGGRPVLRYHKGVSLTARADALARMSSEGGVVMVCTDAAARGLDVPDITHVVQVRAAAHAVWLCCTACLWGC